MKYDDSLVFKVCALGVAAILIIVAMIILLKNAFKYDVPIIDSKPRKDIGLIIENIKSDNVNLDLDYEGADGLSFKTLGYKLDAQEGNHYKSVVIDTKTGKTISFDDFIKDEARAKVAQKELELLSLKYPEFIVNSIKENKDDLGTKYYYVKDNEVIIFYYNYKLIDDETRDLSLRVNYNEIKDYLKFGVVLDDTYKNESAYDFKENEKVIALSFDDGPSSVYNSLILKELERQKAHATFFMVGRMMNSCQKCVLDTYNSGNEVASHTYEHMNMKTNSLSKVNESLNKVNDLYKEITGDTIKYLRPPYGAYKKENLENATMPYILWDLDTEDWRYRDVDHIVNYVLENAHDGGIILMHELYESSYESLKVFLPKLYMMGYNVVSISELAEIKGKTLEVGKAYRALN